MSLTIGIKYPKGEKEKVYSRRLLLRNKVDFQRVSVIATVDPEIISQLEAFGCEITELNTNATEDANGIFDSLLRKMIPAFIEADIVLNLTKDEGILVTKIYEELSENE